MHNESLSAPPGLQPPVLPKARSFSPYLFGWALLAVLALAYLVLLAVKPETIARYLPVAPQAGSPESNEGQRAGTDALAEIRLLRDTLAETQADVAKLKAALTERSERDGEISNRIALLEMKADPKPVADAKADTKRSAAAAAQPADATAVPNAALPSVTAIGKGTKTDAAKQAASVVAPSAAGAVAEAASGAVPAGVKMINAPLSASQPAAQPAAPASALETGSLAKGQGAEAIPFGPAVVKPAPKPVGIQLGSGESIDGLRLNWSLLSDRHEAALKNLQPRYVTGVNADGITYDLVAGPVKSAADAKKLCKDLAAKAVPCKVVDDFKGDAL